MTRQRRRRSREKGDSTGGMGMKMGYRTRTELDTVGADKVADLYGIGDKTTKKLAKEGIFSLKDLQALTPKERTELARKVKVSPKVLGVKPAPKEKKAEPLPPKGTGLATGEAGARRGGQPRSEAERQERHKKKRQEALTQWKQLAQEYNESVERMHQEERYHEEYERQKELEKQMDAALEAAYGEEHTPLFNEKIKELEIIEGDIQEALTNDKVYDLQQRLNRAYADFRAGVTTKEAQLISDRNEMIRTKLDESIEADFWAKQPDWSKKYRKDVYRAAMDQTSSDTVNAYELGVGPKDDIKRHYLRFEKSYSFTEEPDALIEITGITPDAKLKRGGRLGGKAFSKWDAWDVRKAYPLELIKEGAIYGLAERKQTRKATQFPIYQYILVTEKRPDEIEIQKLDKGDVLALYAKDPKIAKLAEFKMELAGIRADKRSARAESLSYRQTDLFRTAGGLLDRGGWAHLRLTDKEKEVQRQLADYQAIYQAQEKGIGEAILRASGEYGPHAPATAWSPIYGEIVLENVGKNTIRLRLPNNEKLTVPKQFFRAVPRSTLEEMGEEIGYIPKKGGEGREVREKEAKAKSIPKPPEELFPFGKELGSGDRYYVVRASGYQGHLKAPHAIKLETAIRQAKDYQKSESRLSQKEVKVYVVPAMNIQEAREKVRGLGKIDVLVTGTEYKDRRVWRGLGLKSYYKDKKFVGWRGKLKQEQIKELAEKYGVTITETEEFGEAEQREAKKEKFTKRAERHEELAAKKRAEAAEYYKKAQQIRDMIPLGQPILVGHHSEKKHRRDLKRQHDYDEKAWALQKEAEEYESKAETLRREATYRKGDIARARQKRREALTKRLKVGQKIFHPLYGEGTLTKINPKSVRYMTERGFEVKVDKWGVEIREEVVTA